MSTPDSGQPNTSHLTEHAGQAATGREIEAALNFDSLHEAEKITGISYKDDESTALLGMALMMSQRKRKDRLLADARDTNSWSQTLAEWMAVVDDMGFRLLSCEDIPGTGDKYRIWWHDDGILLHSDSYYNDKVCSSATAVFNYVGPRNAMHSCSSSFAGELDGSEVWDASRDARDGLRFALDRMRECGRFVKPWLRWGFRWLLHYGDTRTEDFDYAAITAARLARLPDDVRAATGSQP